MQSESSTLIRNTLQPQLLALEAEKSLFIQFRTWLQDVARKRKDSVVRESDLRPLKETATELHLLAMSLHGECLELSAQIATPELDQELTAAHMYQAAASSLADYFMWISNVLDQVTRATSGWSSEMWTFRYESAEIDRCAEQARIYRILANHQYRLDQLEARVH